MSNWTETGISKSLLEASMNVRKGSKEQYEALIEKVAEEMGIEDLSEASKDELKKLQYKVNLMWDERHTNSLEEACGKKHMKKEQDDMEDDEESDDEEDKEDDKEDMKEDTDLEVFDESELDALTAKADELGLKKKLEEAEQLDELFKTPEEKIRAKNQKVKAQQEKFWSELNKAEKHFEKAVTMIQKSQRKFLTRDQQQIINERVKDLNLIWYMMKDDTQKKMEDILDDLLDV